MAVLPTGLWAQSPVRTRATDMSVGDVSGDQEFVAIGRVKIVERNAQGAVRYGLVDDFGTVVAQLGSTRTTNLRDYVDRRVGVQAQAVTDRKGRLPNILVDRVTLLEDDGGAIRQTTYVGDELSDETLQPIPARREVAAAEFVTDGGPVEEVWEGPIVDEGYAGAVLGDHVGSVCGDPSCGIGSCTGHACRTCGTTCGPSGWFWVRPEYLLWWTSGMSVPPLVTTSQAGTSREDAGVLGLDSTSILYGGDEILTMAQDGFRIRFGGWLAPNQTWGWEGDYLFLGTTTENFTASSDFSGSPILARPFFNINPRVGGDGALDPPAREDSELVAFPGVIAGTVTVDATTELQSAGARLIWNACCKSYGCNRCRNRCNLGTYSRVDFLMGYRYMQLDDSLVIREELTSLASTTADRAVFDIFDRFETKNEFHGVELGTQWQTGWRRWSLELLTRLALGNVRQTVDINGGTTITPLAGTPESFTGGLLALDSNIGSYTQDRFGMIPQLGATLGFQLTPRMRTTFGYTLLYWSNVARAGEQIDTDINPDQLPDPLSPIVGPLRPEFVFRETSFWAQGMNFGVDYRW